MTDWVFGYGSLVWKPSMPFVERCPAYIRGWSRRFWQGSTDHRGLPENPGRVVTLVPDAEAKCWGMLYGIDRAELEEILDRLDYREKGGYQRHQLPAYRKDGARTPVQALTYIAPPANPNYLGPAGDEAIALQILAAHGPSGSNRDYLMQLRNTLVTMGANDPHVFAVYDTMTDMGQGRKDGQSRRKT